MPCFVALPRGIIFFAMVLIDEDVEALEYLYVNYKVEFMLMFYDLASEGMDFKTAIWECWNKLKCGGANGRI